LDVEPSLRVAGAMDSAHRKKEAKRDGFSQFQKQWHAWGVSRGSTNMDAWQAQYKRHLQQTYWEVRALIS